MAIMVKLRLKTRGLIKLEIIEKLVGIFTESLTELGDSMTNALDA